LGLAAGDEGAELLHAKGLAGPGPLAILLAEASLVNQRVVAGLLAKHGHRIVAVQNGRDALAALEQQAFDLVRMDVQMPELDGLAATAAIRAKEKSSGVHVPIVAMTAHAMRGDREACLAAGMDAYLAKPIRAAALAEAIQVALTGHGRADKVPDRPLPAAEGVDWQAALAAVQGDRALLRSVVQAFLEEGPRLMAAIGQAIQAGDAAALRRAAHTLKSSLNYVGAIRASDQAFLLEQKAAGPSLEDAEQVAAGLRAEVGRILPVLAEHLPDV